MVNDLSADTIVSQDIVNEMMDINRNMSYQDQELIDVAVQEYKVDNDFQIDPVGIPCSRIEGNFMNILWRKTFYNNLNKCFANADVSIADMYLAPIALADSVLTDSEKRSGCVLVDLGADTTTVSVYYKNILRYLSVIPLGGNNITKDIASLQIDEEVAEHIKLKHASAYTDNKDIDNSLLLPIDAERSVESRTFIEIVEARVKEIIENVWCMIPSDYVERLLGGIILTGGGANMRNIDVAFRDITHIDKIRIATFVNQKITSNNADINAHNAMMNTVLGILAKGNMICVGSPQSGNPVLFGDNASKNGEPSDDHHATPRKPGEIEPGVVLTEDEKKKLEQERIRKDRERIEKEKEEERIRMEEEQKNKSGIKNKMEKIKSWVKKMVQED